MDPNIREWLHLAFRWVHIIAGIMWIGNSMFFAWLDRHLTPPEDGRAGSEGELWMVHSGGFYQVDKKQVAPDHMPRTLHWFKWEAGFTWVSGFLLLIVVYYMGGGVYLIDPAVSGISAAAATALGIALLIVSWVVYDSMVRSPLGRMGMASALLWFSLLVAVAFGLSRVLSGRAAYIHVGAMMGTIMVANVWMRIIPAQRHLVAATREGRKPDAAFAKSAKQRSIHNHYMTFPLLFIMMSNHFPNTYGTRQSWLILAVLMIVGAGTRYFMNRKDRSPFLLLGGLLAAAPAAALYSLLVMPSATPAERGAPAADRADPRAALAPSVGGPAIFHGAGQPGSIRGVVAFSGPPPRRKELSLPAGCNDRTGPWAGRTGPVASVFEDAALVRDGKLQNVFVFISQGLPAWQDPPPPEEIADEITIDQRGCVYAPRVLGARVGQRVTFINSDPVLHNVRTIAEGNATFNELMAQKDMRMTKIFAKPEVMVHTKCDIHPWMTAHIGVLPHPYFAVTGPDGQFTLRNVPPGEYVVQAWHELYGTKTQQVKLGPGVTAQADFSFAARQ